MNQTRALSYLLTRRYALLLRISHQSYVLVSVTTSFVTPELHGKSAMSLALHNGDSDRFKHNRFVSFYMLHQFLQWRATGTCSLTKYDLTPAVEYAAPLVDKFAVEGCSSSRKRHWKCTTSSRPTSHRCQTRFADSKSTSESLDQS